MQHATDKQSNETEKRTQWESPALEAGQLLSGFRVEESADIPDVGGRLWKMTHEKSGAVLFWLNREEEVKTFVIAFKTIPEDDTGVAHILEHAVLQGSEKYPVKSPFDELRKSSTAVDMNAATTAAYTKYWFSTRNGTEFLNLADVYLDAVFHPLVRKDPRPFRQEGWHYEVDEATGELSVNGVVFNEMKGSVASPYHRADLELARILQPGTVYAREWGGQPDAIPGLTHGKLCEFHRRFYHPSNALVFLGGKVPLGDILGKLDASFAGFDRRTAEAPAVAAQPGEARLRIPFESDSDDHKAMLLLGWPLGKVQDAERMALILLNFYFCGQNEAPLAKALLERGLCKSVHFHCERDFVYFRLEDMDEKDASACRETVLEVLENTLAKGIDLKRLGWLLDACEYAKRDQGGRELASHLAFRALDCWVRGDDLVERLSFSKNIQEVFRQLDEGLFERIVREVLLANPPRAELLLVPDTGLAGRNRAETKARMTRLREGMPPEELARIADEAADLAAYQQRPDLPEDIARIPRLGIRDLQPEDMSIRSEMKSKNGITEIRVPSPLSGIFCADLSFPLDGFSGDDLLRIPLFSGLLGDFPTDRHDALTLKTAVSNSGRMGFWTYGNPRGRYWTVTLSALTRKAEAAFGLVEEILFGTRFDAIPSLETILRQNQSALEQFMTLYGEGVAASYAGRGLSEAGMVDDLLNGEQQLRWLQEAKADAALVEWLARVPGRLFRRDGLIVSSTDNLPKEILDGFLEKLGAEPALPRVRIEPVQGRFKGFSTSADSGAAAWAAKLPDGMAATGAMRVAAHILSEEYLHKEVREKGGAYGVVLSIARDGEMSGLTFCDPRPARSLGTFGQMGNALRRFAESGADVERHVIATIGDLEPLRTPFDRAVIPHLLYLEGHTAEDEERFRREVLGTTREQLLEFADVLEAIAPTARTCIVGGPEQLAGLAPEDVRPLLSNPQPT